MDDPAPAAAPPPTQKTRRRSLLPVLLLLCLVAAAAGGGWYYLKNRMPGIVSGGTPPPNIYQVKPGDVVAPPAGKEWAVCANPMYEYWFEYPTKWQLSIPQQYSQQRARMLVPPDLKSAAIIVLPFGLYDEDQDSEISKLEYTYLGEMTKRTSESKLKVNGQDAFRRTYDVRVLDGVGFEEMQAEGVFVVARPKCYVLFLRGNAREIKLVQPVYERVVKSFHLEKLPLRADGQAPPLPDVKKSPSPAASPTAQASPSPAASSSPAASPTTRAGPGPSPAASASPSAPASPSKSPSPSPR